MTSADVIGAGDPDALGRAVAALGDGGIVGLPTDTVYGLAVVARSEGAGARLAAAKGRDQAVPVQVLVADLPQAVELAPVLAADAPGGSGAHRLAARWWPGGLTIVVRRRPDLGLDLGGDGTTVGLRCPAHPFVRALCRQVGPLAATSANRHGEPPLVAADQVAAAFAGVVAVVVDGGTLGGAASTVVDVSGAEPVCRREGALSWAEVRGVLADDGTGAGAT